MSQNNNQNKPGGNKNNRKSTLGIVSILIWAVILTGVMQMFFAAVRSDKTEEIPYSTFRQWVVEDKVATVNMTSSKFTFTLVEDEKAAQEAQETAQQRNPFLPAAKVSVKQYATAPLNDDTIIALM